MAGGGQLVAGTPSGGKGSMFAFVLVCTECREVWEPPAPVDEPCDGQECASCGGWSWVGELAVTAGGAP